MDGDGIWKECGVSSARDRPCDADRNLQMLEMGGIGSDMTRIQMIEAAQSMNAEGRQFHLILDHGSHDPRHPIDVVYAFAQVVRKGGCLVTENISPHHMGWMKTALEVAAHNVGLTLSWYERRAPKHIIVAVFGKE